MLYSYNDCISSFGNDYQIKKSVSNGKLFKICNGIYSDKEYVSELEIVCFKYPMAVFTMDSAFYYHSLTDVIPEAYHLATDKNATKIKTAGIKQYFYPRDKFEVGISQSTFQNTASLLRYLTMYLKRDVRIQRSLRRKTFQTASHKNSPIELPQYCYLPSGTSPFSWCYIC